jgi:hypothetical protein
VWSYTSTIRTRFHGIYNVTFNITCTQSIFYNQLDAHMFYFVI